MSRQMHRRQALIITFLVTVLCLSREGISASAEDRDGHKTMEGPSSYAGLTEEEVSLRLGPPDENRAAGDPQRQTWVYGRSLLFFTDGRVAAWSDNGDLRNRESLAKLRDNTVPKKREQAEERIWQNAWTPRPRIPVEEVIDDILKDR